jgi:hypothetical protein
MSSIVEIVWRLTPLTVLVAACAHVAPAPSAQKFELAGLSAEFRSYSTTDICAVEPAVVEAELAAMNQMLEAFLKQTHTTKPTRLTHDQRVLLKGGPVALPSVLDTYETSTRRAASCKWKKNPRITVLAQEATPLIGQTRARLQESDVLLQQDAELATRTAWKKSRKEKLSAAKRATCQRKKGQRLPWPLIFYASNDGTTTEWWFCDGARVLTRPNGSLALSSGHRGKLTRVPKPYQAATQRWDSSKIDVAPDASRSVSSAQ